MLLILPACDDTPPDPPPATRPGDIAHALTEPSRPTTQALLEGPRVATPLKLIPFTVEAPESWKVKMYQHGDVSATMLEGPSIGDDARISINLREPVSGEILKTWLDKAQSEIKQPTEGQTVQTRDVGEIRMIERLRVPASATTPTGEVALVDWRLTLFVPSGIKYDQYELKFFDLTPDSFKRNEHFFRQLLGSVKHDAAANALPPL
ncbi:MAG TPA: hypothetical protein VGB55_11190 [Tepidisphaeraceae bacterium]